MAPGERARYGGSSCPRRHGPAAGRHDSAAAWRLRAGVFGSFARGSAGPESNLDLLIELPEGKTLFDLERLALDLEAALGRKVDLVTYRALNPRLREQVLAEQVPIL